MGWFAEHAKDLAVCGAVCVLISCVGYADGSSSPNLPAEIHDKTLVAWVYLADLTQQGGSALTVQCGEPFDAIVFGECAPRKWMAGSEMFHRTQDNQDGNPEETAGPDTCVQMAAVYQGNEVTLYRDAKEYARYRSPAAASFGPATGVLMGLRHRERQGAPNSYFAGAIEDARVYARALTPTEIAELRPNAPSAIPPLGWWNFEDGTARDAMGVFPEGKLYGGARIADGKLHLDGKDDFMKTPVIDPDAKSPLHYRPDEGVVADTIPIFRNGEYHIFYLRGNIGKVPWEHIASTDLIHWKELPAALLPDGAPDSPDGEHMFTGSVTEKDGLFYIFYTGHNPRQPNGREFLRRATSPDLIAWTKDPDFQLGPDGAIYAREPYERDWRDPYVFWNEEEKQYWMVVIADDAKTKKPVQGLLTSDDLETWTYQPPLEGADGQECPDLFRIGDTWYLIGGDHYSVAKQARGPYAEPPVSHFIDRPGVYAAKRMFDGKRHIWTGWAWDTNDMKDGSPGIWGGDQCLPRELDAGPEGQLCCRPAAEIPAAFTTTVLDFAKQPAFDAAATKWKYEGGVLKSGAPDGSPCVFPAPNNYLLTAEVRLSKDAEFSLLFRQQAELKDGYRLTLRPNKAEVDLAGPRFTWTRDKCPVDVSRPVTVQVFVLGRLIECFVNDSYAFTCRAYNYRQGQLGLRVSGGEAEVRTMTIKTLP